MAGKTNMVHFTFLTLDLDQVNSVLDPAGSTSRIRQVCSESSRLASGCLIPARYAADPFRAAPPRNHVKMRA